MADRPDGDVARPDPLVDALARASFATTAVLNRVAAEHDLSLTQLRVLAILRDRRTTMGELAGFLGLDRSTVSGLVDRAERRGLLERRRSPSDGRGVEVALSAGGAVLAEEGASAIATALRPLTGALSRPEAERLTRLLERMLGAELADAGAGRGAPETRRGEPGAGRGGAGVA